MFIVYGLPRSRTFWLSRFLTYGDWNCGHDELRHLRSMDDVKSWFAQPNTGTVETAAAPWWRLVPPGVKAVTIRRNPSDVVDSLVRLGFDRAIMTALVRKYDAKLDQIERRVPGVLSVRFEDLANEETCARVFEHCLPYKNDPRWFEIMAPMNLQVSMEKQIRYAIAHRPQLEKLAAQARWHTLDAMAKKPIRDAEELNIRVESFEDVYRDGQSLFREHLALTDQSPDASLKNIDLIRKLDSMGAIQVVSARCNGRVFGYLMTVISPSLDAAETTSAVHTTFYASREFPRLGMRLQRVARDALKERGVDEIIFRAGVRGDGPRMGAMYRRMGAVGEGQLYRLGLKD